MAYLVVLGCGQVGRALIEMVHSGVRVRNPNSNAPQLIGIHAVFDSKSCVLPQIKQPHALKSSTLKDVLQCKEAGGMLENVDTQHLAAVHPVEDAWGIILKNPDKLRLVIADCTASSDTENYLAQALREQMGVVLANKKPLSAAYGTYDLFTGYDPFFKWESTVGAGSPFITSFKRLLSAGDKVKKVAGVFSGTLGYVMTGLEEGKNLSTVVLDAKKQGFTEPDPRDDLSGMDFARKALILGRMMGWRLEMHDIELESLVSEECSPEMMPLSDFLADGIKSLDETFNNKVQAAKEKGCVLRYAATLEGKTCKVGLVEVSKETPLGRLRGTDNILEIHSSIYDPSPLVIQGRGAGPHCTALGVIADSVEIFDTMSSGN